MKSSMTLCVDLDFLSARCMTRFTLAEVQANLKCFLKSKYILTETVTMQIRYRVQK